MPEHWDGFTERRHDDKCELHEKKIKEWVSDKICIATKPTKTKQALMWTIMVLMLGSSGLMTAKTVSIAGSQKAVDTKQSSDIEHNKEQIEAVVEAHKKMVDTQENMQEEIEEININQERVLTILERIERKVED